MPVYGRTHEPCGSTSTPTSASRSAPGCSATTRPCSTSSPAPTSRAASTPVTPRPSAAPWPRPPTRGVVVGAQVGYRDLAGLRPPPHRHGCRRPHRRRALPARRARGDVPRGRHPRRLRQAARRALHHGRRRRGAGQGGRGCRGRLRPVAPPSRAAGFGAAAGRGVGRAARRRPRPSPTAGTPPTAGSCPARTPAPCCTTRARSPSGCSGSSPRERCWRSTARSSRVPARSVCTHGDTPGAVALARAVRARLEAAGVTITPFVDLRRRDDRPGRRVCRSRCCRSATRACSSRWPTSTPCSPSRPPCARRSRRGGPAVARRHRRRAGGPHGAAAHPRGRRPGGPALRRAAGCCRLRATCRRFCGRSGRREPQLARTRSRSRCGTTVPTSTTSPASPG